MTSAEFEALATAAIEVSDRRASSFARELQRERVTLASMRLQAGHLDQVIWFLAELSLDASTAAERVKWCEVGAVVLAAIQPAKQAAGLLAPKT